MKLIYKTISLFLFATIIQVQAQVATIPFELDGLMYVKVKVNDSDEVLNFIFDTGASAIVLDETKAKELGIKADYQQPATGAGGSEMYNIALSQKLIVNDVVLNGKHMVLVDLNKISKKASQKIDGIVGADILNEYVTRLDFDKEEIALYNNVKDVKKYKEYVSTDVVLGYGLIPEVELEFLIGNDKKFKGNFLFDSGANTTFLLNTPFAKKNKIETLIGKTIESKAEGLTTTTVFKIGAAKKVKFKKFEFGEMPIDITNSESGVTASPNYTGILGIKIIKRLNTILDYRNKKLYFKANSQYVNEFEFPLSGFSLVKEEGKIMIENVVKNSEAYKKGVRDGDEVLSLNAEISKNIKNYRCLLKEEGKSVVVKVKSLEGKTKEIIIFLKRLI
ncbi:aspartyl protease family protein [uncultured Lacinutrix sp.]|uniref:aspartyl protease family protein n=1 Tax=uncultured Lacinutrix sp. TaxID=574032 RepID=UPI00262D9F7A|nr:aspartyl protease family protein [uncultured Lacinutrix sp.]